MVMVAMSSRGMDLFLGPQLKTHVAEWFHTSNTPRRGNKTVRASRIRYPTGAPPTLLLELILSNVLTTQ